MSDAHFRKLKPPNWKDPVGYTDGIVASGRMIFLAGQIGWNPVTGEMESPDIEVQSGQALRNIVTVLAEAGGSPHHIVRLNWYVTNGAEYRASRGPIGIAYRAVMGDHYPAATLVVVAGLAEPRARVEIEATAVIEG